MTFGFQKRDKFKSSYPEQLTEMFLIERSISFSREIRLVKWFADFVIGSVILEIDGQQHLQNDRKNKDREKDQDLSNLGYTVVRIPWDGNHSKFFKQLEEFVLLL